MKYYEVTFSISPASEMASDILGALLADEGFEAFESIDTGLVSWVQQSLYSEDGVRRAIETLPLQGVSVSYSMKEAPYENWNVQWEQEGFQPIVIGDGDNMDGPVLIVIHDTVHMNVPNARYDIKINPCQAFGTGSHETTRMILRQLLTLPMQGRCVVDAGTGTGILSILCHKLGASEVLAYDIDEWSVRNAKENLLQNGIDEGVKIVLGDSSVLAMPKNDEAFVVERTMDAPSLIIANINRNILLSDIPRFADCLNADGELLLSGFYTADIPLIMNRAGEYGLLPVLQRVDHDWAMLLLKKEKTY